MNNPENADERLAKKWLESQGYSNIERPQREEDPPDYVVDDNLAVEVRRLNRSIQVNGHTEGEETSRISLSKTIESILSNIDPPGNGQSWIVDCEYDFSSPLPKKKVVEKQIREALQLLTQPYDTDVIHQLGSKYLDYDKHADELGYLHSLHLCLPCGICLELSEISATPARFLLQNVSDGEGVSVLSELESNINAAIQEKSQKIRDRKNKFDRWWLILIDHISYVPYSGLTQTELENLRTSIRVEKPWSKIIIVSLWAPDYWYEILSSSNNLEFKRISGEV